jgi:PAS domain S-box-containing protein
VSELPHVTEGAPTGTAAASLRTEVPRGFPGRGTAEENLRQSEERFRLLIESVRDYAIYLLDVNGNVASWNPGAERLKGYKAEEIIGKPFSLFYPEEARRRNHPAEELRIAAETGRYEEEGWRVRKDGRHFWANVVITPIRDPAGTLRGFAKITRDLTERRRLEELKDTALARLQRSNQNLQEFAMVASHDLQEPLRKIQLFAERLQEDFAPLLPEEGRDYLDRMQRAADRGRALVQGLLAFSRLTTRAQPPMPTPLREVADEVIQDLESQIATVRGKIVVGDLPTLEADPVQMRQLIQNLIGNALKFHKTDVPPVVQLGSQRLPERSPGQPTRWQISISDNGIGFDERYLDKIFKLFQRLHERGSYDGSGMGLAICRKIVERHGGSITARSAPDQGTTFLIELPERQPTEEVRP